MLTCRERRCCLLRPIGLNSFASAWLEKIFSGPVCGRQQHLSQWKVAEAQDVPSTHPAIGGGMGKHSTKDGLSQPIPRRRSLSASCSLAALLNCRNTTVSAYVMRFGPDSFVKWSGNAPAFESSYKKRNACREMRSTRNQMVTCCECPPAARGKSLYKAPASRAKTLLREGQYANGGSDASRTLWTTSTRRSNLLPATTPLLFTTQSGP